MTHKWRINTRVRSPRSCLEVCQKRRLRSSLGHRPVRTNYAVLLVARTTKRPHKPYPILTGIGRDTAIALSKAGWSIVLFARRLDQLRETRDLCDDPSRCLYFEGDVTSESSVQELFRFTLSKLGKRTLTSITSVQGLNHTGHVFRSLGFAIQRECIRQRSQACV